MNETLSVAVWLGSKFVVYVCLNWLTGLDFCCFIGVRVARANATSFLSEVLKKSDLGGLNAARDKMRCSRINLNDFAQL
jgi:hypothetical protein